MVPCGPARRIIGTLGPPVMRGTRHYRGSPRSGGGCISAPRMHLRQGGHGRRYRGHLHHRDACAANRSDVARWRSIGGNVLPSL